MKTPAKDYQQQKATGGLQTVILNQQETAKTDELDPGFNPKQTKDHPSNDKQVQPGDDPSTKLI